MRQNMLLLVVQCDWMCTACCRWPHAQSIAQGPHTVSGGALHMQRKIWAAADFQNFLARPNTRRPRKKLLGLRVFGRARKFWKSAAAQIFLCMCKAPTLTVVHTCNCRGGPGRHGHASWAGDFFFFFLDPRILGSSKIRTDPRRIRIDPGFGGFVLPLSKTYVFEMVAMATSWTINYLCEKMIIFIGNM